MGFQFGLINSINTETGTKCFIAIISFLIAFEYVIDIVQSLKAISPTSYQIIQKLFKELMIMGVVSFSTEMLGTSSSYETHHDFVTAISVTHIVLFFMAIFYVLHAFLLILLSRTVASEYERYNETTIQQAASMILKKGNYLQEYLFRSKYLPGSHKREMAEFKIMEIYFQETYGLVHSFPFSEYLSGCFEKFSLSLLEIGPIGWLVVMLVAAINLARIKAMKDMDLRCTSAREEPVSSESTNSVYVDEECATFDLFVFLVGGFFISIMAIILLIVTRVYETRYNYLLEPLHYIFIYHLNIILLTYIIIINLY